MLTSPHKTRADRWHFTTATSSTTRLLALAVSSLKQTHEEAKRYSTAAQRERRGGGRVDDGGKGGGGCCEACSVLGFSLPEEASEGSCLMRLSCFQEMPNLFLLRGHATVRRKAKNAKIRLKLFIME